MNVKKFALVDLDTNNCLGMHLSSQHLEHRNNLFVSCFDKATGDVRSFQCKLSTELGALNEAEKMFPYVLPFEERFIFTIAGKKIAVHQTNKEGEELSYFINEVCLKSNNPKNVEIGQKLSALKYIDGFISLYSSEKPLKSVLKNMPEDAFIFTNKHGVICIRNVERKLREDGKVKVEFVKYDEDFNEIDCVELFEDKEYKLYGVLKRYDPEFC